MDVIASIASILLPILFSLVVWVAHEYYDHIKDRFTALDADCAAIRKQNEQVKQAIYDIQVLVNAQTREMISKDAKLSENLQDVVLRLRKIEEDYGKIKLSGLTDEKVGKVIKLLVDRMK